MVIQYTTFLLVNVHARERGGGGENNEAELVQKPTVFLPLIILSSETRGYFEYITVSGAELINQRRLSKKKNVRKN